MELSVDVVGIGNREQALGHLSLVGTLQEKLIALQGGRADGPFVTAGERRRRSPEADRGAGLQNGGRVFPTVRQGEAAGGAPKPRQGGRKSRPVLLAAQAQIARQFEAAQADIQIKRDKAAWQTWPLPLSKRGNRRGSERMKLGRRTGA